MKSSKNRIKKSFLFIIAAAMTATSTSLFAEAEEEAPPAIEMPAESEFTKLQPPASTFAVLNCTLTESAMGYALMAVPDGTAQLTSAVTALDKGYSTELFIKVSLQSDYNAALRLGYSDTKQPLQIVVNRAGRGIRLAGVNIETPVQVDSGYGRGEAVELSIHFDIAGGKLTVLSGRGGFAEAKIIDGMNVASHYAFGTYDFSASFSPLQVSGF